MCSIKAIVFLLVSTLFVIEVEAKSRGSESAIRPGTGTGKPRSSLSGIGDDYWFWAYHFSDHDWKDTPMSMQEFAEQNVRIMWQNRPANASATACLQGEWSVTNYDKVSPAMRSAYFTRGGFWSSFSKKVRL
uniref:Uncharacterized protein n=1 Tax=Melanopsichium pennsylvanicum 4 TaxID=1398559 RepID=A0A077QRQ5_9BASI|nr:hypothetical protein BN887_05068 [Melanopsichium pennsylvanicum 4]